MASSATVRGCCPLDCQDTCSWLARVEDGRVVRVEGDPDHPFTRGSLCAKVHDYETRTYAPDRLLYPLRRTGKKGSGQFERISWGDALDAIARRFQEIVREVGPEALLPVDFLGSLGVLQRRSLRRLFSVLGASRQSGSICGESSNLLESEGHPRGFDPEETAESRIVILWGSNPLTTSQHHWHFIEQARKRNGARLIAIDPRRTRTTEQCDRHLLIRPGGDAALAAAIGHVLVREELVDRAFVARGVKDFDAYCRQVADWPPERAAPSCGIDATEIVELAREWGRARPGVIRLGISPLQTAGGESMFRAISALVVLTGNWQLRGGGLFGEANPQMDEPRAGRPDLSPHARKLSVARLGMHLTDSQLKPPIGGVMIWGTNPVVVQHDSANLKRGLEREDLFTVVLEHFMTDTAKYADIVLPSTTQLEHFDVNGAWGHHYISANLPAIAPLGEARPHSSVMRELAARMGLDHPALRETDDEIAASVLPEGLTLQQLKRQGYAKTFPPRPEFGPGKLQVTLSAPIVEPPAPVPGRLQLLTPKAHYFLNSSFANMPRHQHSMGRPTLEMHPADAAERGLSDGQRVAVRNEQGALTAHVALTGGIHRGVAAIAGKWWRSAQGDVCNALVPPAWSPGGQPAFNDTFVEVVPAG